MDGVVEFRKIHVGAYTNEIQYSGALEVDLFILESRIGRVIFCNRILLLSMTKIHNSSWLMQSWEIQAW